MKAIVCCAMLGAGVVVAQEGSIQDTQSSSNASSSTYTPLEPKVPDSTYQRAQDAKGLFRQRAIREAATADNPFVLTPHKPTYFLPVYYSSRIDEEAFLGEEAENQDLDSTEFKYQISLKFPLVYDVVGKNTSLWLGYTQLSYWQAYNENISAPFRDTNYEPELFISTQPESEFLGIKPEYVSYGVVHESNGQSGNLSRSWNRVYVDFLFEKENTAISIKPWYRFPENSEEDDNPDIDDYYGYGEIRLLHVVDDYSIDVMLRNNLKLSDNKGAFQIGFNFPLWGKSRGYLQYFNGYGQSLLDYNNHTQSIGMGIMLTNWL
ncbi:phospholipase A [Marinomonas epiphytica]